MNSATAERVGELNDRSRRAQEWIRQHSEESNPGGPDEWRPILGRDGAATGFEWWASSTAPPLDANGRRASVRERAALEPLGNTTRDNFPSPPEGGSDPYLSGAVSDGLKEGTLYRRRLRRVHQDHHAKSKNQQKCGRVRCEDTVSLHADADGAHWSGLVTCGSGTACPVCGARKAAEKGEEIARAVAAWLGRERGGSKRGDVLFITPTIRHAGGIPDLGEAFAGMARAWARVRSGSGWAKAGSGWRDRLGGGKTIRGIDATHGEPNGWHPHFHYLQFCGAVAPELLSEFESWIKRRWESAVVRELGEAYRPAWDVGVQVERVRSEDVGKYLSKMGLALELSGHAHKEGGRALPSRQDRRAPFQILAAYAEAIEPGERARDGDLWREWVAGTSGRSLVHWSAGLRDDVFPQLELELEEETDTGKPWVMDVGPDVWGRIVHVPDATETVLDVARWAAWKEAAACEESGTAPKLAGLAVLAAAEQAAGVAIRAALDVAPEDVRAIYGGWDGVRESVERVHRLQNDEDQNRQLSSFGVARSYQLAEWGAARRAARRGGWPLEAGPREEYRQAFRTLLAERMDRRKNYVNGGET